MPPVNPDELFETILYRPGALVDDLRVEAGFLDGSRDAELFQDLMRADFAISNEVANVESAVLL